MSQAPTIRIPGEQGESHIYQIQEKDVERILEHFISILPIRPHDVGLDLPVGEWQDWGCGDGLAEAVLLKDNFANLLDRVTGYRGVDLYERRLARARVNHQDLLTKKEVLKIGDHAKTWLENVPITYEQGDIRALPASFKSGNASVILFSNVQHWLTPEESDAVLRRAFDVLQPGGYLLISTNAPGTNNLVQRAYQNIMTQLGEYTPDQNPEGYDPQLYSKFSSPLEPLNLSDLESQVRKVFGAANIKVGRQASEQFTFKIEKFIEAVSHYAMEAYLKVLENVPFYQDPQQGEARKELILHSIMQEVLRLSRGPDLTFRQYSNYLVVQKPKSNGNGGTGTM